MQPLVSRARAILDAHPADRVTLGELARAVGASPFHLQRAFKRALGLSPRDYQREQRLASAKKLIAGGGRVTDAVFEAGYGSVSRFYEKAAARLGMRASDYRARGEGQEIAWAVRAFPIGRVLVAATRHGVCAVKLGASAPALERDLAEEFPRATRKRDTVALARYLDAIGDYLAGDASLATLPLDVQGTVFQRRVWEELRRIPAGQTRTYSDLARAIGKPRAVRAVGSACGANPAALVIPCHRALRADGGLGGYAWGLERKRALLALERRTPASPRRKP